MPREYRYLGEESAPDAVRHPNHYTWLPGIECIDVARHFPYCLGAAIKYIWRAGRKGDEIEDLEKAREYLAQEIRLRRSAAGKETP